MDHQSTYTPDAAPVPQPLDPPKRPPARGMAGAALSVMLLFVASRLSGLLREIVIGAQFGTSAELDAYLAAFRLPDLLFQLVAGGALGSAFIPTFSHVLTNRGEAAAWRLFSRVLNLVTLALVGLAALAALFAHPLVTLIIAPGFDAAQAETTATLMRWMLISTVIFGASGLIMGALNAVQQFALPALAPVLYNLAIISGAWLLGPRLGIYGLVIGVVVGAFAHFGIQLPGLMRARVAYSLDLTWREANVREVGRLMAPRVLGLFFVQLNFLVNTILASGLAAGSLAALNYAWLLMLLPQGIFAQAIATVAFPTFSAQIAANDHAGLHQTVTRTLRMVLFLTVPAAVGLFVLRVPLIQLLLQRGSFDAESTLTVAYALQFYAVGLVAHAALEILVRVFYALHNTLTPVVVGIGAMGLNILFSLWWIDDLGYGGLALANSVATIIETLVMVILLRRSLPGLAWRPVLASTARIVSAAVLMGGAVWGWLLWLGSHPVWTQPLPLGWVAMLGGTAIALIVYLSSSFLLGNTEVYLIWGLVRRRLTDR